jgi:hypothetical protein
VAAHGSEVERVCERAPRTLIHGDFAPKNMRVRSGPEGIALLPFDWGSAGWGVPAADLVQSGILLDAYWANPDLAIYRSVVRESWPYLDGGDLRPLSTFGKIFRCLVCIDLDAESLATDWVERCTRNMRLYTGEMAEAIHAAEWEP